MKLKAKELCPIHRRRDCCGRAEFHRYAQGAHRTSKWESLGHGWSRLPDSDSPDGYRYRLSASAMRRVVLRKLREQNNCCGICGREFYDMSEVVPDHIQPKGSGGGRRDDHPRNIQAAHADCNIKKGSRRDESTLNLLRRATRQQ